MRPDNRAALAETTYSAGPMLYDEDAEYGILGCVVLDREAILLVMDILDPEFWQPATARRQVYEAMRALAAQRIPPDLITLSGALKHIPAPTEAGWNSYLIGLANRVEHALHIEYYAQTIIDLATMRHGLQTINEMAMALAQHGTPVAERLTAANAAWAKAMALTTPKSGLAPISAIVDRMYDQLENGGDRLIVPTGYADLDRILKGGFKRQNLIYLGARPGVGKSSLARCVALNAARRGQRVAFFSLEMSENEVLAQMGSTISGLDSDCFLEQQRDRLSDDVRHAVTDVLGKLHALPLFIDEVPGRTPFQIEAQLARQEQLSGQPFDLVIVDYLGLMNADERIGSGNRVQEIGAISRAMKRLAKRLNCPVLALVQLNRAVESRTVHVPMLSDMRDGGDQEQDADIVLFIHRDEMYDPDSDRKGIAEVHVAKHRGGPLGVAPLRFFASTTLFASLETHYEPEGY
jgi:replicative DNA helicase